MDLKAGTANVVAKTAADNDDKGVRKRNNPLPPAGGSISELPTGFSIRNASQIEHAPSMANEKKTEQQRILELTRQ